MSCPASPAGDEAAKWGTRYQVLRPAYRLTPGNAAGPCSGSHALLCPLYAEDAMQPLDIHRPGRSFDKAFESLLATSVSTLVTVGLPRDPSKGGSQRRQDIPPV